MYFLKFTIQVFLYYMKNVLYICVVCLFLSSCNSGDKTTAVPVAKYQLFSGTPSYGTQYTTYTQDGNIAMITTLNNDSLCAYVTSPSGKLISKKVLNLNVRLWASSITPTPDNGFIVSGYQYDNLFFYYHISVMKFNHLGDTVWTRTYNNNQSTSYQGRKIIPTKDGNYMVYATNGSNSSGNVVLLKIKPNGDSLWMKQIYTSSSTYNLFNMMQTEDGNYLIMGQGSTSYPGLYMIKIDNNGNWIMDKNVQDTAYYYYNGRYSTELPGGDLLLCYNSNQSFGNAYSLLIRADAEGNVKWQKRFSDNSLSQVLNYIAVNKDGGYTLAGTVYPGTSSSINGAANWIMKTDAAGNVIWEKKFRGEFTNYNALNILKTADDGNIITGSCTGDFSSTSRVFFTQMDANGNFK
jgi:hypothetical protein